MPKIEYVPKNFGTAALDIIAKANEIITEYQNQGFKLTLRQLYYRYIAMNLFPDSWIDPAYNAKNGLSPTTKNTEKSYKHLGTIINDARLAGLIDWDAIEDRTRNVRSLAHWNSPSDILSACASQYRIDKWATQKYRPHVWIEKDALIGVIEGVCNELDVPYFSCRGYTSQSEMWSAAMKIRDEMDEGYTPILFHLGDHDPSVTGDTPILLRYRGKIDLRPIKDVVELLKRKKKLKVLALNWKTLKVEFKKATGFYEHWSSNIYKIRYSGGEIRCTGNHSVYIFNEKGDIISKPASELKRKDLLVTFCGDILEHKDQFIKVKHPEVGNKGIKTTVEINSNFAKAIGSYCAEGCIKFQKGRPVGVHFCFDESEEDLIRENEKIMKECFNLSPVPSDSRLYMSLPVAKFFSDYFPGQKATTKRLPGFMWETPLDIFKGFFEGYLNGDGHVRKEGRKFLQKTITTTSEQMANMLIWLTRCKNVPSLKYGSITKSHNKKDGSLIKGGYKYNVDFPSSTSRILPQTAMCKRIPNIFREKKIERKRGSWNRGLRTDLWKVINKDNAQKLSHLVELSKYEENLINSDLGTARINQVTQTEDKELVYDIAVAGEANFFGGTCPILLHNSGIDMTRDIKDRIELFMGGVELQRLALNQDQVEQYNPPPNPAKLTDSRCDAYIASFGSNSWELDSLEPQVLVDILRNAILSIRDEDAWEKALKAENIDKKKMKSIADTWSSKPTKKKGKK